MPDPSPSSSPAPTDPAVLGRRLLRFALRVVVSFFGDKKGLLLAGAVAYNTLLSLIPLLFLVLVVLTHIVDEGKLLQIVQQQMSLIAPGQADVLTGVIREFLNDRKLIGVIGVFVLLFLSSIAFRILEDAIAVVFDRAEPAQPVRKRAFWISAVIPYAYMLVLGTALLALTLATSFLQWITPNSFTLFGYVYSIAQVTSALLYLAGLASLVLLFTSIYKVIPTHKINVKRAMVGGIVAAALWEVTRRVLTWYFADVSIVSVVYGSLATVVVVLVTLEVGAVILLLGATVIAELENNDAAGLPWYGLEAQDGEPAKVEADPEEAEIEEAPEADPEPARVEQAPEAVRKPQTSDEL